MSFIDKLLLRALVFALCRHSPAYMPFLLVFFKHLLYLAVKLRIFVA